MVNRRDNYQKRRKELRYLKENDPGYCSYPSNAEAKAHIQYLMTFDWTIGRIARVAGLHTATVWDQVHTYDRCHEDTLAAILGVKPTPLDLEIGPGYTKERRALGAHRIVTGLASSGWPHEAIAEEGGFTRLTVRRYGQRPNPSRPNSQIGIERYLDLRRVAARLEVLDPVADRGVDVSKSRHVRSKAAAYPPLTCWDLETIHLEDSIPEWTGACGHIEGYRIHIREEIPVCGPCAAAAGGGRTGEAYDAVFSAEKLREVMKEKGFTVTALAEAIEYSRDSVQRFAWSQRNPQPKHIKAMAEALGVHPSAMTFGGSEDIIYDEDFNPEAMKLAIEEKDISYLKLARETGFSHTSFHKWISGAVVPKMSNVRKIAEYFGVDWKVFYK